MAFTSLSSSSSSSSDSEVSNCSKACSKAYTTLKEQYDSLTLDYKKSQYNLLSYQAEYTKNLEKAKKERDELKLTLEKLQNSSKALNNLLDSQFSDKSKAGLGYKATSPVVESSVNSSEMFENQKNVEFRLDKGYHAVLPPITGNHLPPKRDLRLTNEHFECVSMDVIANIAPSDVKTIDVNHKGVFSIEEPKPLMKNNFSPPIIEDWYSDDESEVDISPTFKVKTVKPSIKKIKFDKTARETVKNKESPKQHKHHPRGNQRNWNNLMSQRLGSLQSVEERLVHYKKNKVVLTDKINVLNLEVKQKDKVLAEYTKNLEKAKKEIDELKLTLEKLQNSSKALNNLLDSQVSDISKAGLGYKATTPVVESSVNSSKICDNQENVEFRLDKGYHVVPLPFTGNHMPPKRDLRLTNEHFESVSIDVIANIAPSDIKTIYVNHKCVFSIEESKPVMKNNFSPPIIEDWYSDDVIEVDISPTFKVKTVKPSI
uniref:Uncharacterized protein n=1 Tax=Tanacetum cinerariifolium TaxID=118510 RepID=A0A699J3C3_TANCI|nr:hypothetical protein [Tanacetum cinerariifolium]